MTDVSPKIAIESPILLVPMFQNKALFTSCRSLPSTSTPSSMTSIPSTSDSSSSVVFQGRSLSEERFTTCKCPHVLIADDDPFQKFYYQSLFKRSIEFNTLNIDKESFRVKIVKSGEELITKYSKAQACGCGSLMLIITDYHMGEKNINGVQVAIHLRRLGYQDKILLRTSEDRDALTVNHKGQELSTVNEVLDKGKHLETKSKIQEILKEKTNK